MRISLAEEIREISQVAPKDFDPDELHFEPERELDSDQPTATEHYLLDLGCVAFFFLSLYFSSRPCNPSPSALRKAQDSLSDPKYFGKRVSRAQLLDDDDDDEGEEQSPPSDSQVEDESLAAQEDESDTSELTQQQLRVAQTVNQTRLEDQKKGLAVSRQLV